MKEQQKPDDKTPTPDADAKRVLRRLQGEDGYDIFADRQAGDDHAQRLRDYERDRR